MIYEKFSANIIDNKALAISFFSDSNNKSIFFGVIMQ